MDTIFEFIYYLGIVACVSSLQNGKTVQANGMELNLSYGDTASIQLDTIGADSIKKMPLLLGAQQAKRLSECDTIGIYQED